MGCVLETCYTFGKILIKMRIPVWALASFSRGILQNGHVNLNFVRFIRLRGSKEKDNSNLGDVLVYLLIHRANM